MNLFLQAKCFYHALKLWFLIWAEMLSAEEEALADALTKNRKERERLQHLLGVLKEQEMDLLQAWPEG